MAYLVNLLKATQYRGLEVATITREEIFDMQNITLKLKLYILF